MDQLSIPIELIASGIFALGALVIPLWLLMHDLPDDLASLRPCGHASCRHLPSEEPDFVIWNVALPRPGIVARDDDHRNRHARGPRPY